MMGNETGTHTSRRLTGRSFGMIETLKYAAGPCHGTAVERAEACGRSRVAVLYNDFAGVCAAKTIEQSKQ